MIVLGIDPGPALSAWLTLDTDADRPHAFGIWENDRLLAALHDSPELSLRSYLDSVAIEMITSYGLRFVGAETYETCVWIGRFIEALAPLAVSRIIRPQVSKHVVGNSHAKDPDVRAALIDRFGGSAAIGTTKARGPLYGVSKDVWSALAVAVTYADGARS